MEIYSHKSSRYRKLHFNFAVSDGQGYFAERRMQIGIVLKGLENRTT